MQKVEKTDGCWLWTGRLTAKGYGDFSVKKKPVRAHRMSWNLFRGEIPLGMNVLHSCDNPTCVNPDHLFVGTQLANMHDMIAKGRKVVARGEQHGNSKLTVEQVAAIRESTGRGADIGKRYGIGAMQVSRIKRGLRWRNV